VVTFDTRPTDEQLRSFADPQGAAPSARLDDDGTTLTARPSSIPRGFFWVCLLVPEAICVGALVWRNPFAAPDPVERLLGYLFACAIPASIVLTRIVFGLLIRHDARLGDFFVLDRAAGTLNLLRAGVTLRREDVVELVEVQGRHRTRVEGEGWHGEYIRELSVLARTPDGSLARYPVLAATYARPVRRVAVELAELFDVPQRTLVGPVFFGGWRRED
jgi:hypothetical protein